MTIPTLMNCSHLPDGWCLTCVGELQAQIDRLREVIYQLGKFVADDIVEPEPLKHEDGSLYQVMPKIGGKSFRCECECNVFNHPDKNDLSKYACNCCDARYIGE